MDRPALAASRPHRALLSVSAQNYPGQGHSVNNASLKVISMMGACFASGQTELIVIIRRDIKKVDHSGSHAVITQKKATEGLLQKNAGHPVLQQKNKKRKKSAVGTPILGD